MERGAINGTLCSYRRPVQPARDDNVGSGQSLAAEYECFVRYPISDRVGPDGDPSGGGVLTEEGAAAEADALCLGSGNKMRNVGRWWHRGKKAGGWTRGEGIR